MPPDYYQDLLKRYLDGQCSVREGEELFAWLASNEARRPLLEALEREFQAHAGEPAAEVAGEISERIRGRLMKEVGKRPIPMRRTWMAAAAAILALGVGAYTWKTHTRSAPASAPRAQQLPAQDVAPGGNKALLTLGDGRTIALDSVAEGQLVRQGGAGLVKVGEGQLAYKAEGAQGAVLYNTISTPRGGQYQVVLADGTRVWLNASSTLKFPTAFSGNERRVTLQGEGYFEVAPASYKPFRVTVGTMTVDVLGTHFDIMAYTDEKAVATTLLEGSVRVTEGSASGLVRPGQAALLDPEAHDIKVNAADTEAAVAWKNGYFRFDGVDLPVVMRQLSRWYDVDVDYQGKQGKTYEFVGTVARSANLSSVLKVLEINGVQVKIQGKKLIVTP
jgi:ferric-dicitrate binding protein FerR (iron transport regulator)